MSSNKVQFTIENLIAEGDRVVLRDTLSGTHQGELIGIPAAWLALVEQCYNCDRPHCARVPATVSPLSIRSWQKKNLWVRPPPAQLCLSYVGELPSKTRRIWSIRHTERMFNHIETQGTLTYSLVYDYLLTWIEAFLIDSKLRGLAD